MAVIGGITGYDLKCKPQIMREDIQTFNLVKDIELKANIVNWRSMLVKKLAAPALQPIIYHQLIDINVCRHRNHSQTDK